MRTNRIEQVRPESTFEAFQAQTPEQINASEMLESLASRITTGSQHILSNQYPFPHAGIIFLHGQPGRGKTHLVEAFVNRLRQKAPEVLRKVFLSRDFFGDNIAAYGYRGFPIILLDDLFANVPSPDKLHKVDASRLRDFVFNLYEERSLVIATCNFGLSRHLRGMIAEEDPTGRALSRLDELISRNGTGEIELTGIDWRTTFGRKKIEEKQFF